MDARALISRILRRDVPVAADVRLHTVDGWDSLKAVHLVLKLEEIIGHQLSEAEIEGLQSVRDVEAILNANDET
jgi:acyl carrier protein